MPRQVLPSSVTNSFTGGFKTEYTGLNFPENAAIDTDNCVFDITGRVTRRLGIDQEAGGTYNTIRRAGAAITSYSWYNASGDTTVNLFVLQVGGTLYFYNASLTASALSNNLLSPTISLSTCQAAGAPIPDPDECQFAQGNGFLFVFHKHCDPFSVSFNAVNNTVTATIINITIRDFTGLIEAGVPVNQRPGDPISAAHRYNLANQGWTSGYALTSTTSQALTNTSKTWTVNLDASVTPITVGERIVAFETANSANTLVGTVTAYSGTTLTASITSNTGAGGPFTDWTIVHNPDNITAWRNLIFNWPSNADIWWEFKDANDVFNPILTINNIPLSTSPASKGHFIVNAFNIDRTAVSGLPGSFPIITTSGERPNTGAFFQGRVFYTGVNNTLTHSNIYFSRTIANNIPGDFGICYKENDPTDSDFFDILTTDGGLITIQGAGNITKLWATRTALIVFCTNGIWAISGSGPEGLGFAANDYTVVKVSNVRAPSASNFVEVLDSITWWNLEGIYVLSLGAQGAQQGGAQATQIQSLTNFTIKTFYTNIPSLAMLKAKGAYDPVNFVIRWVFRSTPPVGIENSYMYDKCLVFNTLTQSWYKWTIANSPTLSVNGVGIIDTIGGSS